MVPRRTQGFTLIELLVVIAIIGVLASVVMASLSSTRARARDARTLQDVRQIVNAFELYRDTAGGLPSAAAPYVCLKASGPCWFHPVNQAYSYAADAGVNAALAPYMPVFPRTQVTTLSDSYLYAPNLNVAADPFPQGPYLLFPQSKAANCPGYIDSNGAQASDGMYWCYLYLNR